MTEYPAKILRMSGKSAVVVYKAPSDLMAACIVDYEDIAGYKPGDAVYITDKTLSTSTPYGLDWSVFYPDGLTISPQTLQNVMYQNGIVTLQDLKNRASDIPTILAHLYADLGIQLYQLVKQEVDL